MDCPIGVLLPDEQDKHMEKESGCGSVAGFSGAIALLAGCAILLKKKQR